MPGRKQLIPVTIVTGPRGAGKTTLINRLLETPAFVDTAVILNDFGEVALKNTLVETADDSFISLGSGCVCCSVRGALADGLENMLRDLDNGRVATIARVIIEADEAADPSAILLAIVRHPYLSLRFVPDGIIAVLDASTAAATLAARADTVRQVAMADVVALSRYAHVGDLRAINPQAKFVDAARVSARDVVGYGPFDPATGKVDSWIAERAEREDFLSGEAGRIRAFSVHRAGGIPLVALDRFVDYLAALQGPNLIRVRGAVATGEGETLIVEGFGPFFYPPILVDASTEKPVTRFAVVARDMDRTLFEGYLDAFLNEARVDTPDREALTANPLAIAGFSARGGGNRV